MPYIGKQPLTGAYQLCDTITTSATATYNLLVGGSAVIPGSANNCIVSLNGVVQAPVGAFTVSGSTITFASTLSATDVIDFILILGNVFDIGTPTNGAVTNSSLNSNVITGQTAETTVAGGDLVLLYDDSASALRKMTRTNLFSGVAVNGPAFLAYPTNNQTLLNNTGTKAVYDQELFDTANCYDPTTNYRFTPNVAGYYSLTANFNFSGNSTGTRFLTIYKNGGATTGNTNTQSNNLNFINVMVTALIEMNGTTDYVEVFAAQNSGSTLNSGVGSPAYVDNYFFGFLARKN